MGDEEYTNLQGLLYNLHRKILSSRTHSMNKRWVKNMVRSDYIFHP